MLGKEPLAPGPKGAQLLVLPMLRAPILPWAAGAEAAVLTLPKKNQSNLQGCHRLKALHHVSAGARPWAGLLGPNKAKIPGFSTFATSPSPLRGG